MNFTIASLAVGEQGIIQQDPNGQIPLILLEMGCFPGANVELIQIAPLKDPLYIKVNGSHLAIRKETAKLIKIEKSENLCETLKL
ncbi:ferrous iron transport protein A [Flavobacteriaceae bacterium F08102]|nr:ferrous iron transport protein A [Flavobacteriaceae bacterium F08102]